MILSNITEILPVPDKKGYFDIYADGELILTISEDAVIESGIRVGDEIDSERLSEIESAVSLTKAKAKAYNYLSYGDLSKNALFKKLNRFGFDADICKTVCHDLEKSGYINDERYAKAFASYLASSKLYGPRRILQELCIKGISKDLAENCIAELETDFDGNIKVLCDKKFRYDQSDRKGVSKLISALIRYGYDYDSITTILSDSEEDYE